MRGTYCAFVDVYPVLFDPAAKGLSCARRLVVRLSFPPGETRGGREAGAHSSPTICSSTRSRRLRGAGFRRAAAGAARTPFEFALSSSWVKIGVKEKGIYIVTYNDLLSAGANPALIDPATLRLFSGGPYPEPDSLSQGGSFRDDYHFTEHAILYRGQGGGSLQPTDTVFFYGLPVDGLGERRRSLGESEAVHQASVRFDERLLAHVGRRLRRRPAQDRRARRRAALFPGDTLITWYEERIRSEKDLYYDPIYVDDRWYWNLLKMNGSTSYFSERVLCERRRRRVGRHEDQGVRTVQLRRYSTTNTATYRINGVVAGTLTWIVPYGYNPSSMKTLEAAVSNIVEGRNVFSVSKPVDNEMYVFWYEIFYHRLLKASQGALDFGVPERERRARYELAGFPAGEKLLFDVTFDEIPVLCTGWQPASGGLVFEDSLQGRPRRYAAVSRAAFKKGALSFASVPSLRDESACPDMVILYHGDFRDAALTLKAHREQVFPGVGSPVVRAVDIEDVYNNFSGGHKDPIAIRNYLKFLYDRGDVRGGGEPVLKYVLLSATARTTPANLLGQKNDFVPLYINVRYPNESEGIEDEDFFVKLDDGIDRAPDLAIGRMSVLTSREANAWAQRIVDYEERPEHGTWRNKVILVADDEFSTTTAGRFRIPRSRPRSSRRGAGRSRPPLDVKKVYLHLYPFVGDVKPAARKDLLQEWSDGALIVNYNGHGSPLQMADERVMVNSDIYSLTNGMRRPLFLSFSCSVGDLDSPYHRSMAQNMMTYDAGGAIGTIAAAAPTYLYPNELLNEAIYESIFTSKDSTGTRPVGLRAPAREILDRLSRGIREQQHEVHAPRRSGDAPRGAVVPGRARDRRNRYDADGGEVPGRGIGHGGRPGALFLQRNRRRDRAGGRAEDARGHRHRTASPIVLDYTLPGKELFRGTVDVTAGRFSVEFVVPRRCHTGPDARIRSYVSSPGIDGVGACDTLRIVQAETPRPDLEPPSVHRLFRRTGDEGQGGREAHRRYLRSGRHRDSRHASRRARSSSSSTGAVIRST